MTVKDAQPNSSTTQGVTAHMLAHQGLYETRRGLFGGHAPLFDPGATTADPAAQGQGAQQQDGGESQLARSLQNLINRHGGADRTAELLFGENREYRARIRELEGQLPAAGTLVLTADQAQAWQAYQQLGPDPAALRDRLTQGVQAIERETSRTLADASGANPDVLADRLRVSGLRAEVRDIPAEGTTPARREVRVLNAEGQDQGELRAYATQHWAPFVPALYPTAQGAQGQGITVAGQAGPSSSTPNPGQSLLEQRIAAREQAANPTGGTA